MEEINLPEGLLLAMGNPLLDISAPVPKELLEKYNLDPNGAIMAEEKHMPLYKELTENYKPEYIAGGSALNSLRVAQWLLKKPKVCTYFGCVGNDEFAKILREKAISDGVNVQFDVCKEAPTGTCAVLVTNIHRSLVANLAAAQRFNPHHLDKWESQKCIEQARIFYSTGFFVAVSPESMLRLAQHMHAHGYQFVLNVSAPFVVQFFKEPFEKLLPFCDVLIGNEMEIEAFGEAFGLKDKSREEISLAAAAMHKLNPSRPRVVICTQGAHDVIVAKEGQIQYIPVPHLDVSKIVDTTGAGDSFVGGFLSQLVLNRPVQTCVECGIYASRLIIQQPGCTLIGESNFVPSKCECPK